MFRVVEYFGEQLKVTQGRMCKSLLVFHCNYVSISYTVVEKFSVKWRNLEICVRGRSK